MDFKKYKRKGLSEMVSVAEFIENGGDMSKVSVSVPDQELAVNNPHEFDKGYIARNPANHEDMWYVAKDYFDANLEPAEHEPDAYTNGNLTFGHAIEAAKKGHKVARSGWNGKGMYAIIMPGYPEGIEVNEATQKAHNLPAGSKLVFRPYWQLFTAQNDVATWAPSGSDSLAEDWMILD